MEKPTIWYFIKFFTDERYADKFVNGNLFLNRLSYFRKIESSYEDVRTDTNEAVSMWWQPHDLIINLTAPGVGIINITKDDLAGPVSMSHEFYDHLNVLCLYAVCTTGFSEIHGKPLNDSEAAELQRQLHVDERCLRFGRFAVITPAVQFLSRMTQSLKNRGLAATGKLVEYYDDSIFHGEIATKDVPIKKQKRFSYQQEFRICVQTKTKGDNHLLMDIGDISDICKRVKTLQLNEILKPKPVSLTTAT